jgi:hypothetical protein
VTLLCAKRKIAVGVLRGVPAEMGDGRRRYFAGCSREETSSPFLAIPSSCFGIKGCRRELLLSPLLLFLDRRRLQSWLLH